VIIERRANARALNQLLAEGCEPVLARLLAARDVDSIRLLHPPLNGLLDPQGLMGLAAGAQLLTDAINHQQAILIVADYDCDGATACAVMVRGLRSLGAQVDYLVPNRFEHGYGLTPPIIELAKQHPRLGAPRLLVTVDNGIASLEGVASARAAGMKVLITDHHLPGTQLPDADAIVNPNQTDCRFASKHLAGVGVALYVLLATRAKLRAAGAFEDHRQPNIGALLDLVAIGTVADLVRLDANNRALVNAGIQRIRNGQAHAGVKALFQVASLEARRCSTVDIGFGLAPRINAAGRLQDISIGIACLLEDDPGTALQLAQQLDQINRARRKIEGEMRAQADNLIVATPPDTRSTCLYEANWHEGVVGLIASRIKDQLHRPVFAFAQNTHQPLLLRGSGRSIPGVHLRDVLDLVSKREPDLIDRFGGHAMAAGLTLGVNKLERFRLALEQAVIEFSDPDSFRREIQTDGSLPESFWSLSLVEQLGKVCWGQGFAEPLFHDEFMVSQQRLLKDKHLKMLLRFAASGKQSFEAIYFNRAEPLPERCRLAYQLGINEFNGSRKLEVRIRHFDSAAVPAQRYN
jgi:single-stranded-DNA-specific exonuclease